MIKLFNRLNPFAFFLAFCVGLFLCYVTAPKPTVLIKYPTPETSGLLTFMDDASNCYKFKTTQVKCPKDKSLIKEIPFFQDN